VLKGIKVLFDKNFATASGTSRINPSYLSRRCILIPFSEMQYHIPKTVLSLGRRLKRERNVGLQSTNTNSSSSGTKSMFELERTETGATKIGRFILRGKNDDLPQ
jgi:hypothetical protein